MVEPNCEYLLDNLKLKTGNVEYLLGKVFCTNYSCNNLDETFESVELGALVGFCKVNGIISNLEKISSASPVPLAHQPARSTFPFVKPINPNLIPSYAE